MQSGRTFETILLELRRVPLEFVGLRKIDQLQVHFNARLRAPALN
jgi:hypothetical protein